MKAKSAAGSLTQEGDDPEALERCADTLAVLADPAVAL
jgi:hypothetical protein